MRNRTFFFADYERTHLREGVTRVTNVPTLAERRGDFSQSLFPRPFNFLVGQPFPGGVIPEPFQSPQGRAIAALYPEPNRSTPFANFVSSPTLRDDIDQLDARIDQSFGGGRTLTGRYSFSDRRFFDPFAGPTFALIPGFGTDVPRRGQNVVTTFTHTPSSSLVNDMRFGYNRVSIGVFAENTAVSNASLGVPAFGSNPRDAGLSVISIAGFSSLGHEYTTPQESTSDTVQVSDTATWVRGAHLAKFGGEWYGVRQSAYRDVQARGFLTFVNQGYTGNALADLLIGLPVLTGGARLDNPQNLRAQSWSLFAHDEWHVAPALTISAGARYDYISPPVDADDRANLYDPATGQLVAVGTGTMPRGGYEPDRNNIAPRAGFAWMTADGRRVVRGGYGIYYNQGALATSEGLFFNPPYFNLSVFFPGTGSAVTLANPFPASFPVFIPQSATAYQRDLKTPWMDHWNLNLQHQIGQSRSLDVAYVGSRGHDLISARDLNQAPASPSPQQSAAKPRICRCHADRIARNVELSRAAGALSATSCARHVGAHVVHPRQVDRRRVGLFHERGGSELSTEQPRPGRRARPVVVRRAASVLGRGHPPGTVRDRAEDAGQSGVAEQGARRHGIAPGLHVSDRPALYRGAAARRREQQHRPIQPRVRLQRPSQRNRRHAGVSAPYCRLGRRKRGLAARLRAGLPGARELPQFGVTIPVTHTAAVLVDAGPLSRAGVERLRVRRLRSASPIPPCVDISTR